MNHRTFLALDMDEAALDALEEVRARLDDPAAKIRWVSRANLHLTLRFLGEVDEPTVARVCQAASSAAGQVPPFDWGVGGLLCVPPKGELRMLWAETPDTQGGLERLYTALLDPLAELGFAPEDRRFRPHVTLARVTSIRNATAFRQAASIYSDRDFGAQRADELVVYGSKLTPGGPVYTPLARTKLTGP